MVEAIRGVKTANEIPQEFGVHPTVIGETLIRFLPRRENSDQTLIGKYGITADKRQKT